MWKKICTMILIQQTCDFVVGIQTESTVKPKLYEDEDKYFLRFKSHKEREEYLQCILANGTNIIFYGNYTKYGHALRTHGACFNQTELNGIKDLARIFRDYNTLDYYMDWEYYDCYTGPEATLQPSYTGMARDYHISVSCINAFRDRVVNFQVKSYPWLMGFEIALLTLLLLLGIPANTVLLLVIWRNKEMHTTANIFIANLAAADLMNIMVYTPLSVLNYVKYDVTYGDIICKTIMSACDLFMIVSLYTFICMSAYRYMGIRSLVSQSRDRRKFTKRGAVATLALVWVMACCLCSHTAMGAGVVANHCFFRLGHVGYIYRRIAEIIVVFLAPFLAVTFFSLATSVLLHRSAGHIPGENQGAAIAARKRSANVPIALILQFFVCHISRLVFLGLDLWCRYSYYAGFNHGLFVFLLIFYVFSSFLTYFHSCLPPIMLFFTSSNVRGYVRAGFKMWFKLGDAKQSSAVTRRDVKKKS